MVALLALTLPSMDTYTMDTMDKGSSQMYLTLVKIASLVAKIMVVN
jgi:hypothetical protein